MIRCLIVDDSPHFAEVAARLLTAAGMEVLGVAGCGANVLPMIERSRPDVVLVDVELGPECGSDVARLVSARTGVAGPVVILMSARSRDDLGTLIEGSTAVGFLTKDELSGPAVERLLSAGQEVSPGTAGVQSASCLHPPD